MNCKHFIISILIWTKHSARSRSLPVCSPLVSLSSFLFYFFFSILCFCYFQAMHVYAFPYSFAHFPTFFVVWFQVRSVVCVRFWFVCYLQHLDIFFRFVSAWILWGYFSSSKPTPHTHSTTPPLLWRWNRIKHFQDWKQTIQSSKLKTEELAEAKSWKLDVDNNFIRKCCVDCSGNILILRKKKWNSQCDDMCIEHVETFVEIAALIMKFSIIQINILLPNASKI